MIFQRAGKALRILGYLWIAMLVSGLRQTARAQTTVEEYQIKAAFLFHFAQLVDWPADAPNAADSSLSLCVFDDEPHRQELQSAIESKLLGAKVFHLRQISQPQNAQGCRILFLSRAESRRQTAVLKSLRGLPVLTVGETNDFLSDGGMIRFHLDQDRIRFDVNLGAADASRIKISSRLLLLATSVKRGAERGR
jgi:hypothetical protein